MKIDYDVQTFQPITLLLWYHLLIYLPKAKFCVMLAVVRQRNGMPEGNLV